MSAQAALLLNRTIFRKMFIQCKKNTVQWISRIDRVRNGNNIKSLRWSIKQVLYVLAWAQLWNKRKNWIYSLLKMRENGWRIWKGGSLLGAAFFNFDTQGIKTEEIEAVLDESESLNPEHGEIPTHSNSTANQNANSWTNGPLITADTKNKLCENGWECLMMKNDMVIYRKLKPNSTTYTYKVFGRYTDISASDFLFTHVDNSYRRSWDKYIRELECLDENEETSQELLYWIVKYPYPMMSRDYLLVRRTIVDRDKNRIAIITRSTTNKQCPPKETLVRVEEYESTMLLYPHTRIEKIGFDFQLTSVDNPKTHLPRPVTNYAVTSAIPDFISRMHLATKQLHQVSNEDCPHCIE